MIKKKETLTREKAEKIVANLNTMFPGIKHIISESFIHKGTEMFIIGYSKSGRRNQVLYFYIANTFNNLGMQEE